MKERVEIRLARFAGKTAVDVRFGLSKLGEEAATRLNPFACGRTGLGYAFHDHPIPKHMQFNSLDRAEVWVKDERTGYFVPYNAKKHGKYDVFNLPEGETVAHASHAEGTRAVHRHNGTKYFGTIEYTEE